MVKNETYIPERGDIVWLNFYPRTVYEQSGRRPALVITPKKYNQKVGLAVFCPVTRHIKEYPFEVKLPIDMKIKGVILSDHAKNLDWKAREAEFIDKLPTEQLNETLAKLNTIIGFNL